MYPSGATPLRGRYLVRNPALYTILRASDGALEALRRAPAPSTPQPPRRLLLAIGGHLGDAVLATSLLPVLVRHYPGVELGMVLPSWSAPAVEGHPALRWIHAVDHWKTNRVASNLSAKWRRYRHTRRRSIADIRAVGYDTAVDLYPFFPNLATVLWRAGIPVRVGYRSGGFGSLYTHAADWRDSRLHTSAQHLRLLSVLDPTIGATFDATALRCALPPLPAASRMRVESILDAAGLRGGDFVVVHPGVGAAQRAWPTRQWVELADRLSRQGHRLMLTGMGQREALIARQVAGAVPSVVDLCDQLDWPTFRGVLSRARLVIGLESAASHAAAAEGTPCVSIYSGITDSMHWRPLGDRVAVVTHGVPCAPCFRANGCSTMACVREVTVDDVLEAARRLGFTDSSLASDDS